MAEHYVSDEEQLENIKNWLKTNGPAIIAGIVIGVAAIVGWQYWTAHRAGQAEQASLHYQNLVQSVDRSDYAQAREQGQTLIQEFADTPYGALTGLMLARLAVEEGDMTAAIRHLEWVIEHADLKELKDVVRLRLVRVLLAKDQLDEAEAQLNQINNANFTAQIQELKGDIHSARNQWEEARNAYQAALAASGPAGNTQLLQIKLNNLPSPAVSQK
jgi:predicted negative regulator of RcsB-dependent stress response